MDTSNYLKITLISNYRFNGEHVIAIKDAIKSVDVNNSSISHDIQNWDRFKVEESGNPLNGTGTDFSIVDTTNESVFKDGLIKSDADKLAALLNNHFNNLTSLKKKW